MVCINLKKKLTNHLNCITIYRKICCEAYVKKFDSTMKTMWFIQQNL